MSIIYACMGETNSATGKRTPGHFFHFKSCRVCKCKVKGVFRPSWNWWFASKFLFMLWKEIELFLVLIVCNTKWCFVNCFVLGSEGSYCPEEFDSLCVCPGGNLALLSCTSGTAAVAVIGWITLSYNCMNFSLSCSGCVHNTLVFAH